MTHQPTEDGEKIARMAEDLIVARGRIRELEAEIAERNRKPGQRRKANENYARLAREWELFRASRWGRGCHPKAAADRFIRRYRAQIEGDLGLKIGSYQRLLDAVRRGNAHIEHTRPEREFSRKSLEAFGEAMLFGGVDSLGGGEVYRSGFLTIRCAPPRPTRR